LETLGVRLLGTGVFLEVGIDHLLEIVWEGQREVRGGGGDCSAEVLGGSADLSALCSKCEGLFAGTLTLMTSLRTQLETGIVLGDEALSR
jgi:hypothetical protein